MVGGGGRGDKRNMKERELRKRWGRQGEGQRGCELDRENDHRQR